MFPIELLSEESIDLIPGVVSLFSYSLVKTPVAPMLTGMTKHFTFNTSLDICAKFAKFSISFQPLLYYILSEGTTTCINK
jgi:hypothetical protein